MERWSGKIALVTGASSGIGAAITAELVKHGMRVIGVARRLEKIEVLKSNLNGPGELYPFKADILLEEDIARTFQFIRTKFGTIHVLVNNAGIIRPGKVILQDSKYLKEVIDLNVLSLSICTQFAWKLMSESKVNDGHIIHINSTSGHMVTPVGREPLLSIYPASKFAVTALTEIFRQEFRSEKVNTRVTSISPGPVKTEIGETGLTAIGEDKELFTKLFKNVPMLNSKDIADAVIYVLSTPPHVQVHEIIIKPTGDIS